MRNYRSSGVVKLFLFTFALVAGLSVPSEAAAQRRGQSGEAAAGTARASAPPNQDLIGNWVAVVTEYWHLRMTVPPKGEYSMLPLNPEGLRVADAWEPADDVGNECRSYGAAAIMRIPGRLRIQWADDDTLQIDIDSGTQTRLFNFGASLDDQRPPSWQGYSVAAWERTQVWGAAEGAITDSANDLARYLKVTTTRMRPGYLRKNGVAYSENAVLEEHFDTFTEPNGDTWLIVTSIIIDPEYLARPYAVTNQFRKLPDESGWDPTPCRVDRAR